MTDTAPAATPADTAPTQQTPPYDEDLLVELLVQGQLSYRKIADRVGTSTTTVSNVSRGRSRPDLHERICQLVEDTHRRTRRRAAASIEAVYEKYLALALESEGETARKACEFILKTFANAPDPAGRYIALQTPTSSSRALKSPVTRQELDLLAALRNDPNAPTFDALSKPTQDRLAAFVSVPSPESPRPIDRPFDSLNPQSEVLPASGRPIPQLNTLADVKRNEAAILAGMKYLEDAANRTRTAPVLPDDPGRPDEYDHEPRTDFETDLPDDELPLRRHIAAARVNGRLCYGAAYFGPDDDLIDAGLTPEQVHDADIHCCDGSWSYTAETLMGRECALITTLGRLRLGEETFTARLADITAKHAGAQTDPCPSSSPNPHSAIRNPQSNVPFFREGPQPSPEAYRRLLDLRQLERTCFPTHHPTQDVPAAAVSGPERQ